MPQLGKYLCSIYILGGVCNKKMGDCNLMGEIPVFVDCNMCTCGYIG